MSLVTLKNQYAKRTMTLEKFQAEATTRFGDDPSNWVFVCPGCGHEASVKDYENAKAPEGAVGFSCIGRYLPTCRDWLTEKGDGPCNYTNGGLFKINTLTIIVAENDKEYPIFELANPSTTNPKPTQP